MAGTTSVYRIARSLLIGLVALLAAGVIGSFFMSARATSEAKDRATDEATAIVQNLPLALDASDLAAPASDAQADALTATLAPIVFDPTAFDRLTIYSPSGVILYSTDTAMIGQRPDETRGPVHTAVGGTVATSVSDGSFTALVPLSLREGGPVTAVVQLTRDDGPIASASGPWRFNAIFLAVALVVVTVLLWRIGRLSASAVAHQSFLSPAAARVMTPHPVRPIEVPTPGLREEGEARRRAEERARAAEDRLQVLQDQYRTTIEDLHHAQRKLSERAAAPPASPETEERLLKSEGRVRLLEGQLQAVAVERDRLAKQIAEASQARPDGELERRTNMVQQEAIGLRAELEGAQTELSLTRRQLDAIKEQAGRTQELQEDLDAAHVEIMHARESLEAAKADSEQARAELDDARGEIRALRTEEQRAAVLADQLRAAKAELESAEASHRAELVEREADLENRVRRTREEFQAELQAIQTDLRRQLAQREAELTQQREDREAELTAELQARESAFAERETALQVEAARVEAELKGEMAAREAELQTLLEERRLELQEALEARESDLGAELSRAREEGRAADERAAQIQRELQETRDELGATRRELADHQERGAKASEELLRSQTEIEMLQREMAAIQHELDDTKLELGSVSAEVQTELGRGVELVERAERAERDLRVTQERAEQAEQEIERLRAETDRVRVEAEQVRTQADQLRSGSEEMERGLAEADERHRAELAAADERHRAELAAAADGHGRELATATEQHQRRLAEMQEQHRAEVEELRAQLGERPDVDEILRASQERLATQTERLVEIEERAHRAERELGQSLARQEEVESELRHLQMEKAMRDLRDQEAAEAAAAAAAAHPIVEAEAGPIEDRRASTPFTKELSLDAKKTLSQIMGVTQVLKYKKDGKDQTQLIKQLTASVRRLEHTVSDLADIDSLVRGSVELSIRRADLEALVRRVAEESGVGQDHDLRVEADPVVVGIDPQRTEQIVSGLLRASGERTAIGKQITLRLTARDGGALIAVEDPETSSDASLSPVVKRFAEVQGGWAGVQSREEGGSRFQVFLPDGGPNGEAARPRETGEEAGVELGVESPGDLQIMVNAPRPPDEPWTGNPNEELLVQELHHLSADD